MFMRELIVRPGYLMQCTFVLFASNFTYSIQPPNGFVAFYMMP